MPYLDKIVDAINQDIVSNSLKGIPAAKIMAYGIAETIIDARINSEDQQVTIRYPGIVDDDSEIRMIDVDDRYSVIIYHKVESVANGITQKTGYGDSYGNLLETANMSMLIYAFRDKVRNQAWWFEAAIKDQMKELMNITDKAGTLKMQRSAIRLGNSSFDKINLLAREYSEIALNYPNLIVIEIKYRIESTWKKGCFLQCGCNPLQYIALEVSLKPILQESGNLILTEQQ